MNYIDHPASLTPAIDHARSVVPLADIMPRAVMGPCGLELGAVNLTRQAMSRSPLMLAVLTVSRGASVGVILLAVLGLLVMVGKVTDGWTVRPWFAPLAVLAAVCASAAVG